MNMNIEKTMKGMVCAKSASLTATATATAACSGPLPRALDDIEEFVVKVVRGLYKGGVYKVVDIYPATTTNVLRYLIEIADDEGDIVAASRCIILEDAEPLKTVRPKKRRFGDALVDEGEEGDEGDEDAA